jgi:hypothetical protein
MLGYIRRIGKEFRGPYTLKTLYNSFVRSHLDYASAFEKNRGYPEEVFEIRVAYAGMEPRYSSASVLSKVPLD